MIRRSPDEKTTAAEFGGALLPAGLLVLFATWSGTFAGGAKAWPTLMGWLALLLVAWFGLERWRDPLRLGPLGLIPWAGWLVLALSLAGSPVPRAGSTALLLFPILLLVPAGVARLWRRPGLATIGVRAISAVLILVALWSIIDRFRWGAERAAMPLGHHNLLALWLVVTLPLSVLPLFEGSARTRWRMLGAFGLLLGAGALVLTRSLGGAIGMSAEVAALIVLLLVGVVRVSRLRRRVALAVAGLLVALLAVFQAPRALSILAGGDSSALARLSYWRGGISGWQERPWFGWGPGASSWLAGEHVQPVRGASLAHQVVTDLHSTPIELLFEVGLLGAAAAAALLAGFVACRVRERWQGDAVNRSLSLAGFIALIGFLAGLTVSGLFDVTALGVAGAVLMGVLLAGPSGSWSRSPTLAPLLGLLLMAALLVPRWRAHWHYEQALAEGAVHAAASTQDRRSAPSAPVSSALDAERHHFGAAVLLDPDFPLYRLRLAGLLSGSEASLEYSRAAWLGRGLAPLWLVAGRASVLSPDPRATRALERACDLDPLGGIAPFLLLRTGASAELDRERASRMLVAEPRLAAAGFWLDRPHDLVAAVAWLVATPLIDAGWRSELRDRLPRVLEHKGDSSEPSTLVLQVDAVGETSLSLFAFRRSPREQALVRVPLVAERLELMSSLPPAFDAPGSVHDLLASGCRFGRK